MLLLRIFHTLLVIIKFGIFASFILKLGFFFFSLVANVQRG